MHELVSHAGQKGVDRIRAEMMDTQISAQKAFQRLGFQKAAELKNFVIDINGKSHGLVIMVNDVSDLWKKMEDLLIDYDITGLPIPGALSAPTRAPMSPRRYFPLSASRVF